jgi:hypothetical protein
VALRVLWHVCLYVRVRSWGCGSLTRIDVLSTYLPWFPPILNVTYQELTNQEKQLMLFDAFLKDYIDQMKKANQVKENSRKERKMVKDIIHLQLLMDKKILFVPFVEILDMLKTPAEPKKGKGRMPNDSQNTKPIN